MYTLKDCMEMVLDEQERLSQEFCNNYFIPEKCKTIIDLMQINGDCYYKGEF